MRSTELSPSAVMRAADSKTTECRVSIGIVVPRGPAGVNADRIGRHARKSVRYTGNDGGARWPWAGKNGG